MSNMMTAAVYHALDDIRIEQRPVPEIGPDDILLKTLACGLCGSETMAWYKKAEPKVLGHEPIGEVVKVGANVTDYKIGRAPFCEPPCWTGPVAPVIAWAVHTRSILWPNEARSWWCMWILPRHGSAFTDGRTSHP